jgi:hypothetical protein
MAAPLRESSQPVPSAWHSIWEASQLHNQPGSGGDCCRVGQVTTGAGLQVGMQQGCVRMPHAHSGPECACCHHQHSPPPARMYLFLVVNSDSAKRVVLLSLVASLPTLLSRSQRASPAGAALTCRGWLLLQGAVGALQAIHPPPLSTNAVCNSLL